ncbi:MAG: hypothetical protein GY950_21095, partial [bacterium]|nr:hypothetical protein [bacterium]
MDTNLYEMIDLVHVPGVNRILAEHMEIWEKQVLKAGTGSYDQCRQIYFQRLFVNHQSQMAEKEKKLPAHSRTFWFELQQYEPWKWRMMDIQPHNLGYNHQYKILPTDIIEWMADFLVNPDHVEERNNVHSALLDKNVDLKFVRYSSTHIFGTVKESSSGQIRWEDDMATAFQAFFEYRNRFPEEVINWTAAFAADIRSRLTADQKKPV